MHWLMLLDQVRDPSSIVLILQCCSEWQESECGGNNQCPISPAKTLAHVVLMKRGKKSELILGTGNGWFGRCNPPRLPMIGEMWEGG